MHAKGRDNGLEIDERLGGKGGNHIHPFLMCSTAANNGEMIGMFFVGNAPQVFEVVIFENSPKIVINYITLGGPIEIYLFIRLTPDQLLAKFHALIGTSVMPPYYSLGIWQGSTAYRSQDQLNAVLEGYKNGK